MLPRFPLLNEPAGEEVETPLSQDKEDMAGPKNL
jgi:hypothetical protein